MPTQHHARLRTLYDELWRDGRDALATGMTQVDPLPVEGGSRWGISAVLRPTRWPGSLVRCAVDVAATMGADGVVYDPRAFHLTLRQFECHRVDVPDEDAAVRGYSDAVRELASGCTDLSLTFAGLTASTGGVLVQGWPHFDLQAMRERLQRILGARDVPLTGPETSQATLRTSAHATLAIFGARVAYPDALVAYVDDHRDTWFATLAFDALWLVGYARTATTVRLIEYGRFPLAASAGPSR